MVTEIITNTAADQSGPGLYRGVSGSFYLKTTDGGYVCVHATEKSEFVLGEYTTPAGIEESELLPVSAPTDIRFIP